MIASVVSEPDVVERWQVAESTWRRSIGRPRRRKQAFRLSIGSTLPLAICELSISISELPAKSNGHVCAGCRRPNCG